MKPIKLVTPSLYICPIKDFQKLISIKKEMIVCGYAPVTGDINGNILCIFTKKDVLLLLDVMQKTKLGTTKQIKRKEQRLILQITHVLSVAYLNAMIEFLGFNATSPNPRFVSTFGASINDFVFLGLEKEKFVIVFETHFSVEPSIKSKFIIVISIKSLNLFMELIHKKAGKM